LLQEKVNFAISNIKQDNIMRQEKQDYCYLNIDKMVELSNKLEGSEIKMIFAIIHCLNNSESNLFINNAENRNRIAKLGFSKTPERFSSILGSLTKKGVLKRELNGVYSISENLYIVP
jgi:hypothetical protein